MVPSLSLHLLLLLSQEFTAEDFTPDYSAEMLKKALENPSST